MKMRHSSLHLSSINRYDLRLRLRLHLSAAQHRKKQRSTNKAESSTAQHAKQHGIIDKH